MQNLKWLVPLLFFGVACGSSKNGDSESGQTTDSRTEIRLQQYLVQGKGLYQVHCSNCHQADGSGFAKLYPPLAKSDYLMADVKRAACIIKNGMEGEVTVNGTSYNLKMPANETLTPIDVAEILTYVTNSWGNDAGISSTRDVTQWIKNCEKEKP